MWWCELKLVTGAIELIELIDLIARLMHGLVSPLDNPHFHTSVTAASSFL